MAKASYLFLVPLGFAPYWHFQVCGLALRISGPSMAVECSSTTDNITIKALQDETYYPLKLKGACRLF